MPDQADELEHETSIILSTRGDDVVITAAHGGDPLGIPTKVLRRYADALQILAHRWKARARDLERNQS